MYYGYEHAMGFWWIMPLGFFALMVFCMFWMGRGGSMCGYSHSDGRWRETRRHEKRQVNQPMKPGGEGI